MAQTDHKNLEHGVDSNFDGSNKIGPDATSKEEDEKHHEELFNEIKRKNIHKLYCPNCTENITDDAKLSRKRKQSLVIWFPIVFFLEFPFVYLPWFFNNTSVKKLKKHVLECWLKFLLFVLILLLSVIVMWTMQSSLQPHRDNKKLSTVRDATSKPETRTKVNERTPNNQLQELNASPPPKREGEIPPTPITEKNVALVPTINIPTASAPTIEISPVSAPTNPKNHVEDIKISYTVKKATNTPKSDNQDKKTPSRVKEDTSKPKPKIKENQEKDVKPYSLKKEDGEVRSAHTIVSSPTKIDDVNEHTPNNTKEELNPPLPPKREGETLPTSITEKNVVAVPTIKIPTSSAPIIEIPPVSAPTNPKNHGEDIKINYIVKEATNTPKPDNQVSIPENIKKDPKLSSPSKRNGKIHMVHPIVSNNKNVNDDKKSPSRVKEDTSKPKQEIKEKQEKDVKRYSPKKEDGEVRPTHTIVSRATKIDDDNKKPSLVKKITQEPKPTKKVNEHTPNDTKQELNPPPPPKREGEILPTPITEKNVATVPTIKISTASTQNIEIPPVLAPTNPKNNGEDIKINYTVKEATNTPKPDNQVPIPENIKKDPKLFSPSKGNGEIYMVHPIVSNNKNLNDDKKAPSRVKEDTSKPKPEIKENPEKDVKPYSPKKEDGEVRPTHTIVSSPTKIDDENKKPSSVKKITQEPNPTNKVKDHTPNNTKQELNPPPPPKREGEILPTPITNKNVAPVPTIKIHTASAPTIEIPPVSTPTNPKNHGEDIKINHTVKEATNKPKPDSQVSIPENIKKYPKLSSPSKGNGEIHMVHPIVSNNKNVNDDKKAPFRSKEDTSKPKPEIKENQEKDVKPYSPKKKNGEIRPAHTIVSSPTKIDDDNKKPSSVKKITQEPKPINKVNEHTLNNQKQELNPPPPPKREGEILLTPIKEKNVALVPTIKILTASAPTIEIPPVLTLINPNNHGEDIKINCMVKEATNTPKPENQVSIPENIKKDPKLSSPPKENGKIHMVHPIVSNNKNLNDDKKTPSRVKRDTSKLKTEIKENKEEDVKPSSPKKEDGDVRPAHTIVSNSMKIDDDNKKPSSVTKITQEPKPTNKGEILPTPITEINVAQVPTIKTPTAAASTIEIPPVLVPINMKNHGKDIKINYTVNEATNTPKPYNQDKKTPSKVKEDISELNPEIKENQEKDVKPYSQKKNDSEVRPAHTIVSSPMKIDDDNKKPSLVKKISEEPKPTNRVNEHTPNNQKQELNPPPPPKREGEILPTPTTQKNVAPVPTIIIPTTLAPTIEIPPISAPTNLKNHGEDIKIKYMVEEATNTQKPDNQENMKKDQKLSSPPKRNGEIHMVHSIVSHNKNLNEDKKTPSKVKEDTFEPKLEFKENQEKDAKPSSPKKEDGEVRLAHTIVSSPTKINDDNKKPSPVKQITQEPMPTNKVNEHTPINQKEELNPPPPPKHEDEIFAAPITEKNVAPIPTIKISTAFAPTIEIPPVSASTNPKNHGEDIEINYTVKEVTDTTKPDNHVRIPENIKKDLKLSSPPKGNGEIHMDHPIVSNNKKLNDDKKTPSRVKEDTSKPKPEIKDNKNPSPVKEITKEPKPTYKVYEHTPSNQKQELNPLSPPKREGDISPTRTIKIPPASAPANPRSHSEDINKNYMVKEATNTQKLNNEVQVPIRDIQKKYPKPSSAPNGDGEIHSFVNVSSLDNQKKDIKLFPPPLKRGDKIHKNGTCEEDNQKPPLVKKITPEPKQDNKDNQKKDLKPSPPPKREVEIITPADDIIKTTKILISEKPPTILWKYIEDSVQKVFHTELDILKSIVYGGLIMSITSLGVVSSAAGSGASTRNVMVLGLANLFSGLFLIIHNLNGLIMYQPRFQSANNDHMTIVIAEDPYQILLGKRRNVKLHCFVVVVSFIFFGVIPPLFYGLSFKRSNKKHYKAMVVFAASLVSVIFLSFAKAYAFDMKILKIMLEYTGIAILASTLSFITSKIVSGMLGK